MNYYNGGGYYSPQQYVSPVIPQTQMMYPQQQYPTPQINEQNDSVGFIWVQGREGAKAYPVAPNKTVLLLDSENPYIYKKQTDKDGKPIEFKCYKLVEQTESEESNDFHSVEYATKDDIDKLNREIGEIKDTILDIQTTPDPPRRTRRSS